ncbi:MAG: phage integrase SAM-like domain-containing protein [Chitinophagaceae bacterium]
MSSLKIVLRKKADENKKIPEDKPFPIAIRITKDRISSYTYVGHSATIKQWDDVNQRVKKSHPNSARLNNLISTKYAEANNKLLDLETLKNDVSSRAIKSSITSARQATFFKQADIYLDNLKKHGKFNRHSADKPRIERFREFLDGSDATFSEINPSLLKRFKAYLKGTRSISDRTVVNHLVVIRTIFNQALSSSIVDRKYYPFGKGKIVIKFPDSIKMGLVADEVKAIEDLELPSGSPINHSRNVWLFSFYFAGMRVSDVLRLKWTDFQDDRMYYSMGKNDKGGSLKVPDKALKILAQYKRDTPIHNLVFPDLETVYEFNNLYAVQQRINQKVKKINEGLVDIAKLIETDKKLTMHIARHTFGNISGEKIPIQMLQKLYRHSSITTTIGYQANFIHKDADDALGTVINF